MATLKSLLLALLMAVAIAQSFDEGITKQFVESADAKAKAKETGKPLMVRF